MKTRVTVATSGAFQYLHYGHLNLLRYAASLGNLTILLNSDRGILEMKGYLGETFPFRKANLLLSGFVDRVFEFDTDPTELLSRIKPDIFCVGDDHSPEEIMSKGGGYAGKIIRVPYTVGVSSTEIHKKLRGING